MSSKTPHIYLISGLGADYRVFQKIDLQPYSFTHIKWDKPINKRQFISDYANGLTSQIKHKNPILIGVSFGGIIAIEIAKLIPVSQTIIISSVKTKHEIPLKYRLLGYAGLVSIIPEWILNKNSVFLETMFGIKSEEGKKTFKAIVRDTDTFFMKWAINQIVAWSNTKIPINTIHIHGSIDKILPVKLKNINYSIKNGGHFMVYENAKKINHIIIDLIKPK